MACGTSHSLLLSKSGELFSLGDNSRGQLGLGDRTLEFSTAPLLIQEFKNLKTRISQIACGGYHCLAVTSDNYVFSWGSNKEGECGQDIGSHLDIFLPLRIKSKIISNVDGINQICCGSNFSGFITGKKEAFLFGSNGEGQLGVGERRMAFLDQPAKVDLSREVLFESMSLGYRHSLFLASNGRVYGSGINTNC